MYMFLYCPFHYVVNYDNVSFSWLITSLGEERAEFLSCNRFLLIHAIGP